MTFKVWPERLKLRDTELHDDLGGAGQRIFTTAGQGYEKKIYISAEATIAWAVSCWNDEVKNRPMQNVYRSMLDLTWRQVIRHAGGDDRALIGPTHQELKDE